MGKNIEQMIKSILLPRTELVSYYLPTDRLVLVYPTSSEMFKPCVAGEKLFSQLC